MLRCMIVEKMTYNCGIFRHSIEARRSGVKHASTSDCFCDIVEWQNVPWPSQKTSNNDFKNFKKHSNILAKTLAACNEWTSFAVMRHSPQGHLLLLWDFDGPASHMRWWVYWLLMAPNGCVQWWYKAYPLLPLEFISQYPNTLINIINTFCTQLCTYWQHQKPPMWGVVHPSPTRPNLRKGSN